MNRIGLIFLLALAGSGCTFLPPKLDLPASITSTDELEPYLEDATANNTPPSISIGIIDDNEIVYTKSFGHIDSQEETLASVDTVYQWWSLTKIFTAVAILQLQEQKLLSIDDPVKNYVPTFVTRGKHSNAKEITLMHLLSHSSGLGDIGMPILGWVHFDGDPHPNQTELFNQTIGDYNKLKAAPGTQGRYSNLGYMALAAVVESVSGLTYEEYIIKNILSPLGMQHTDFEYSTIPKENIAQGSHPADFISKVVPLYLDTDRAIEKKRDGILWFNNVYSNQKGSTGLIGSTNDLLKFMSIFLTKKEPSGVSILSNESIALMQTPVINADKSPAPVDGLQFGLCWFIGESNGEITLNHGGSGMAFVSMMVLYPENSSGTIVMANSTYLGRTMGFKLSELLGQLIGNDAY